MGTYVADRKKKNQNKFLEMQKPPEAPDRK